MDAFVGVGGNMIQFAKACGYCVGVDLEQTKCDYSHKNAVIYGLNHSNFDVVYSDFLKLGNYD